MSMSKKSKQNSSFCNFSLDKNQLRMSILFFLIERQIVDQIKECRVIQDAGLYAERSRSGDMNNIRYRITQEKTIPFYGEISGGDDSGALLKTDCTSHPPFV